MRAARRAAPLSRCQILITMLEADDFIPPLLEANSPSPSIPGRAKILTASLIFDAASVLLLVQFLAIHCTSYAHSCSWATGQVVDWTGAASCVGWFAGFSLLIDWLVFDTFDAWGRSRRALVGATLKLIASGFFCVEPFSDLAGYLDGVPRPNATGALQLADDYPRANGVPWSNFVGILFFHTGNVLDALCMWPLFSRSNPCSGANLPVLGMTAYMIATWLLAVAGGIAYAQTPAPWGPAGTLSAAAKAFVAPGQIVGAAFLLIGSLLYTAWAACVGKAAKTKAAPLLFTGAASVVPSASF